MNRRRLVTRRRIAEAAALFLLAPLAAPQLLAFPYMARVNQHHVRSVEPISPAVLDAVRAADDRVAAAPLGRARPADQPIFLTGGGWRWHWLAATSSGAMALTRVGNESIIVNRLDAEGGQVLNGRSPGGRRGLVGVITHEMTHGSIRAHFGLLADLRYSQRLREGYCDYVAGGGTLSDAEAKRLIAAGMRHPALPYWQGRKQVEAAMARPGMTVDAMFATWEDRSGG